MMRPSFETGAKTAERVPTTMRSDSGADAMPLLSALFGSERGVEQRYMAAEGCIQLCSHCRSEADLGDEQNCRVAGVERRLHGGQVDGGLAGAGDSV